MGIFISVFIFVVTLLFTVTFGVLCLTKVVHGDNRSIAFLILVFCTMVMFFNARDHKETDDFKQEYNSIVYALEDYEEKGSPYDLDLLDRIDKWNKIYSRYRKYADDAIFKYFFPESNIEGTKEIILRGEK